MCGYSNDYTNDDIDWIPYAIGEVNAAVPTSAPTFDATEGIDGKGPLCILAFIKYYLNLSFHNLQVLTWCWILLPKLLDR